MSEFTNDSSDFQSPNFDSDTVSDDSNEYFSCYEELPEDDGNCSWKSVNGVSWVIDIPQSKSKRRKKPSLLGRKIRAAAVREHDFDIDQFTSNVSVESVRQRKVFDIRRLYCISRPQYSKSCGPSSVVSVWNYLFSSLGAGSLRPITQEEALTRLGFNPPFGEIRFGPFTGNMTLLRWFRQLCQIYGVRGRCFIAYKPIGRFSTKNASPQSALESLKAGLTGETTAFIYHCYNHYFCPIGFEETNENAENTYDVRQGDDATRSWIFIGDTSRKFPPLHCFDWSDIITDLTCRSPEYLNIRKLNEGVQVRVKSTKQPELTGDKENEDVEGGVSEPEISRSTTSTGSARGGRNLHCIMQFERVTS